MVKFYTRTGDAGMTSLYSGERVAKECLRIEAYGSVDELQAQLGMARALCDREEVSATLLLVEEKLVQLMAELATVDGDPRILGEDIEQIEQQIDAYTDRLPSGFKWSMPGDSPLSAALHLARTVARRCEREAYRMATSERVRDEVLVYLNRISDLCYALVRFVDEVQDA